MHPLWAVPPLAFLIGVVVVLALVRRAGAAAAELRHQLGQLAELKTAVDALRGETDRAGAAREALRHR